MQLYRKPATACSRITSTVGTSEVRSELFMKMTHGISREKGRRGEICDDRETEKEKEREGGSEYPIITLGTSQENTS
jgi:general stress protein YciG